MNCEFCRAGAGFTYIKSCLRTWTKLRLRQAKMTHLPADFLRKHQVVIR